MRQLARAAALVILVVAPLVAGCAGPGDTGACGRENPEPGTARSVIDLHGTLEPLRDDFNAHVGQWRAVLLVSPTCGECVLGARAVEREIMQRYPAEKVHASVVWVNMLGTDNTSAAHVASGYLPRVNATHFYDGRQVSGRAYRDGPFADMATRARAALPPGHWLLEDWECHRKDAPQWDLYMLYAPGVRWETGGTGASSTPTPTAWIRHIGPNASGLSVYWRDTPDTPPREGDLFEGMREMADETMGTAGTSAKGARTRVEIVGFTGCPNTPATRANVEQAFAALGMPADVAYVDQGNLADSDPRRAWPSPTVLIDGKDAFGMARPSGLAGGCRIYPGGAPGLEDLKRSLSAGSGR